MKTILPGIFLVAAVWVLGVPVVQAEATLLVDTTFAEDSDGALPLTISQDNPGDLPLKAPTNAAVSGEGGRLFVQSKGVPGYEKPVVMFEPGVHPDNPDGVSGIKLIWNLRQIVLEPGGIYELEFTVIPTALPLQGGRIMFSLLTPEGRNVMNTVIHITQLPSLFFNGETFGNYRRRIPVVTDQVLSVKVRLDLEKNQWAAWVDGQPLVENELLPEKLTSEYPQLMLGGFDFGSEGGLADKPGGTYAIGGVKLSRVTE
ncbi:MAG: hypothetical protein IAE94_10290 [Chthoniobacterales bacterium]|nr:hypothetical protein [Chthoniobacterales bacterium]